MVKKNQINRGLVAARAKKRLAIKNPVSGSAKGLELGRPPPDPEESKGRRPGLCPLCGAKVAYDSDLRMNEHLFKGTIAVCAASDREFKWMPGTVEAGLPRRQRGGGAISPKDLERMRRAVTRAVASHREAKRAGERIALVQSEKQRQSAPRERSNSQKGEAGSIDIVRCVSCGQDFQRAADESSRRCSICEPSRGNSVRAYGGGLPGLGRRS